MTQQEHRHETNPHQHQHVDLRGIVQRALSQMEWTHGLTRQALGDHFSMAPTVRNMIENDAPDKTYNSPEDVMNGIPQSAWDAATRNIEHGSPENHYRQSRAAQFSTGGETPGFGHLAEQGQHDSRSPGV